MQVLDEAGLSCVAFVLTVGREIAESTKHNALVPLSQAIDMQCIVFARDAPLLHLDSVHVQLHDFIGGCPHRIKNGLYDQYVMYVINRCFQALRSAVSLIKNQTLRLQSSQEFVATQADTCCVDVVQTKHLAMMNK